MVFLGIEEELLWEYGEKRDAGRQERRRTVDIDSMPLYCSGPGAIWQEGGSKSADDRSPEQSSVSGVWCLRGQLVSGRLQLAAALWGFAPGRL